MYNILAHPLLSDPSCRFQKLSSDDERLAQNQMAELLLELYPPAYTGDDASYLATAVAIQVAYQLERGYTPDLTKSQSRTHPGDVTSYRDRYLDSRAHAMVARVTHTATVGFWPYARGL